MLIQTKDNEVFLSLSIGGGGPMRLGNNRPASKPHRLNAAPSRPISSPPRPQETPEEPQKLTLNAASIYAARKPEAVMKAAADASKRPEKVLDASAIYDRRKAV